jgi:hypothetical protein
MGTFETFTAMEMFCRAAVAAGDLIELAVGELRGFSGDRRSLRREDRRGGNSQCGRQRRDTSDALHGVFLSQLVD